MARKTTHIVRTTIKTDSRTGKRAIQVQDMMTGQRKTFPINYAAGNKHVEAALNFTGADGVVLQRETRTGRGNVYHAWINQ